MFNKTRIERIFKYLAEDEQHLGRHDVEIMELKAKVEELETEFNKQLNSLKEEFLDSDKFVGYLHGCANDNYDLINGLRDRIIKLEEKHRCNGCAECVEVVKILTGEVKAHDAIIDDCETRINQLEIARAEMKKGLRELEEKHCCSECGKCDGACQE